MDEPSEETAVIEEKGKDSSNGSIVEVSKGEVKSKGDGGDTSAVLDRDEQNTCPERKSPSFNIKSSLPKDVLLDRIRGTIYGNCIGDAIGLLTEFMLKEEAEQIYRNYQAKSWLQKLTDKVKKSRLPNLEYHMKSQDMHRERFATGDWTDDSDQMILILLSLVENDGKMVPVDFAKKMRKWCEEGFKELGDIGGMGIGRTTHSVLRHPNFLEDPHEAAKYVWEYSGRVIAPNGGVMRTSILGVHEFGDIDAVIANTVAACKVTHADPRCIASCVAVTTAIASMLQGKHVTERGEYDIDAVIKESFDHAYETAIKNAVEHGGDSLETTPEEELRKFMFAESLSDLQLAESRAIGYTYKCMGSGFWSLRQNDFRASLEAIAYEGGDADTNGAVAGALLGCKLGASALPPSWLHGLKHKDWLDQHIDRFLTLLGLNENNQET